MQVFVCVHAESCSPPSMGIWLAPVCPASHLSPLQDKGSSISGPLLRLLEMIWSVLLSTQKIISSQRGPALVSAGPCGCPSHLREWWTYREGEADEKRKTSGMCPWLRGTCIKAWKNMENECTSKESLE